MCVWRYKPEQRSLEARNERVETGFGVTFESRPNASLKATIVNQLLAFLDEAKEGKKKDKNTQGDARVGG